MILVFGSLNADLFFNVTGLPAPGETVLCPKYNFRPGGKGANQAVAAASFGEQVEMIGSVGNDVFASPVIEALKKSGVGVSCISQRPGTTGTACVMVEKGGENQIVVASGANLETISGQVDDNWLNEDTILLLQMEVPIHEIRKIIFRAREAGSKILLNLAPALTIDHDVLKLCDFLILNAGEAELLAGKPDQAKNYAKEFFEKYNAESIITLGNKGAVLANASGVYRTEALELKPVDTVGAGDAFVGVFAASLSSGKNSLSALSYASIAGGLTCLVEGAQASLLSTREIEKNIIKIQPPEKIE
ncbi:MAG: ribokinase [Rhodospirillaceae bacterium]|nr:ribokinase [Rhodospirillaceae bacterium]MBT6305298.1 ribokinase [Rhodospirillaceae bacterium]